MTAIAPHPTLASTPARSESSRWTVTERAQVLDTLAPHLLVADDDRDMCRLLARALRNSGYDVTEAHSGHALLNRLGSGLLECGSDPGVDLLVTDVRMPGASGLDILAGLRRAGWQTPVILLTGFGDAALHGRAAQLGALAVFDKPFEVAELCRFVRSVEPLH